MRVILLTLGFISSAAMAAEVKVIPNGPCAIETQEGAVVYGQSEDVYVCQGGVWTYFYSRAKKN